MGLDDELQLQENMSLLNLINKFELQLPINLGKVIKKGNLWNQVKVRFW